MEKVIFFIVVALVFSFTIASDVTVNKAFAHTLNNSTAVTDQRDNNAPLVNQGNRSGYEPNYLNAEGKIMSYSTDSVHRNWSWLGFLGLLGLLGLVGRSRKSIA